MDEIACGIWLGDHNDGSIIRAQQYGVFNVIDVRGFINADRDDGVRQEVLDALCELIRALRADGRNVLVHCNAGIERSPLVVAWYFHKMWKIKLHEAYDIVRKAHPETFVRDQWVKYNE